MVLSRNRTMALRGVSMIQYVQTIGIVCVGIIHYLDFKITILVIKYLHHGVVIRVES